MTPTLFSVSYAGLWGQHQLGLEAYLEKAAELGYPAVEIMAKRPHLSVLDYDDAALDKLRLAAQRLNVQIATIAGYTDFTSGRQSAEVPFVEIQVAYVKQLATIARKLGAKIVRVFTGYTTDPDAYVADWDKCVRAIRECADVAAEQGVVLGVQNHHDTAVSCAAYVEFLNEVNHPHCKAMFDPWSPALHNEDLYQWAKALAPRMVQTTLADYIRLDRFAYQPGLVNYRSLPAMVRAVPMGDGFIDNAGFLRGLKEAGFNGFVAYEMCSPLRGGGSLANLDHTARISLQRIKEYLA